MTAILKVAFLWTALVTQQQVAEMKSNLSLYVESLAEMDKQHKEWLKQQATADKKTDSSEVPPEVIN